MILLINYLSQSVSSFYQAELDYKALIKYMELTELSNKRIAKALGMKTHRKKIIKKIITNATNMIIISVFFFSNFDQN